MAENEKINNIKHHQFIKINDAGDSRKTCTIMAFEIGNTEAYKAEIEKYLEKRGITCPALIDIFLEGYVFGMSEIIYNLVNNKIELGYYEEKETDYANNPETEGI